MSETKRPPNAGFGVLIAADVDAVGAGENSSSSMVKAEGGLCLDGVGLLLLPLPSSLSKKDGTDFLKSFHVPPPAALPLFPIAATVVVGVVATENVFSSVGDAKYCCDGLMTTACTVNGINFGLLSLSALAGLDPDPDPSFAAAASAASTTDVGS